MLYNGKVSMSVVRKSLQRVGNSTGVVFPADILRDAGFERGDEILVCADGGQITITKLDPDFDRLIAAADRFVSAHANALKKLAE